MQGQRQLIVIADDYGIGPATSKGILDLAERGRITGAVLLVNSPFAEDAVHAWQRSGGRLELGWHPCLTLDRPLLPPKQVPSLVDGEGKFRTLGGFVRQLCLGRVRPAEIAAELQAQHRRYRALVGRPPGFVNAHHHVQVFPPVGRLLQEVLKGQAERPYVRRIREPWTMLPRVPGARKKRLLLSILGRRDARLQEGNGFPGNDWLAGVTDPPCVHDPEYLVRWLTRIPGQVVELACHPGFRDATLLGRDCTADDGMIERRIREYELLREQRFAEAARHAGFTLVSPSRLRRSPARGAGHAA